MRIFVLLIAFLTGFSGYSQEYGDSKFYLIDSLDLTGMNQMDRVLLDSCLDQYHTAPSDTTKISILFNLSEKLTDDHVSEQYDRYTFKIVNYEKDNPHNSKAEMLFYFQALGTAYANFGFYAEQTGNITYALDCYLRSLRINEAINNKRHLTSLYLNLSSLYYNMDYGFQAMDFSLKAKDLVEGEEGMEDMEVLVWNNLAVLAASNGDYLASIEYHHRALELCHSTGNIYGMGMGYNNIGGVYGKLDSFELAHEYFIKSEIIFKEMNNMRWLSLTYHKMGTNFLRVKDYKEAERYGDLCYDYAKKSGQVMPLMRANYLLYRVNQKTGNFEDALYHYRQHDYLKDSIAGEETKMQALQKELNYKNEKENAIAAKENEKKWEVAHAEEKRQRTITYAILVGLILVIIFSIVLYFRLRIITRQKEVIEAQNNERKLLLKEIHHRVKNNFQIVSSVLKLQAAEEDNDVIDQAFDDAINRIHSMAAVHEMIYKQEDFGAIVPRDYFVRLTDSMRSYAMDKAVDFEVDSDVDALNIQVLIPLGISVNEMITNSLKYAFKGISNDPKIIIQLEKHASDYVLSYKDNGVGVKQDNMKESFGMELIQTIIEQIDGRLEWVKDDKWNTHFKILFK